MPRFVSLLRGINVSGKRSIRMADLRACYEGLGFSSVATYVQSGNVVFDSTTRGAAALARNLEKQIKSSFGHDVTVIVRAAKDFSAIIEHNPFAKHAKTDPTKVHVTFLTSRPNDASIGSIENVDARGDELVMGGTEVFLHCPNGYGRTKLNNAFFERKLKMHATTRNWKTVEALNDMMQSA